MKKTIMQTALLMAVLLLLCGCDNSAQKSMFNVIDAGNRIIVVEAANVQEGSAGYVDGFYVAENQRVVVQSNFDDDGSILVSLKNKENSSSITVAGVDTVSCEVAPGRYSVAVTAQNVVNGAARISIEAE